nr:hypothetical protein [Tanacetum cinerariifolium]
MESLSPQVVSAAKLLILNPNEFDLWKMRIEQYFLMTDYSLWEVILNDARTLMEAIKKQFGGNKETKKMAMLTIRARRFIQRTGRNLGALGLICQRWNAITATGEEQVRDELKLKLYKFQTSSKNLSQLLASQTNDKTRLGYDNQVFNSFVFDWDEMFSSESDVRTFMPPKPDLVFHDAPTVNETVPTAFNVEPSTTKPTQDLSQLNRFSAPIIEDWVFDSDDESEEFAHLIKDYDYYEKMVQKSVRNHALRGNHQHYARMTHPNPQRHVVPTTVLTRSRIVPLSAARPVNTAVPQTKVHHQRPVPHGVHKPYSLLRRHINHSPSPPASNFHQKVTTAKAPQVNVVKGVKGNWVWKPKCPILDYVS